MAKPKKRGYEDTPKPKNSLEFKLRDASQAQAKNQAQAQNMPNTQFEIKTLSLFFPSSVALQTISEWLVIRLQCCEEGKKQRRNQNRRRLLLRLELLRHLRFEDPSAPRVSNGKKVSGLKSITSKHLALASQIISFVHAIIPEIRRVLFLKIPETRKVLLLSEIERVAQDYKVHRDEIHTKLVQIMRERLLANLRKLPQIVEIWNASEDNDLQPSQFARHVTKEVTYLHRILSQILLEADVHAIFRQVVQIFHSLISEAFSKLDVNTPQARNRLRHEVQHILGCIRKLPSDNSSKSDVPNYGLLDEFLAERFAPEEAH